MKNWSIIASIIYLSLVGLGIYFALTSNLFFSFVALLTASSIVYYCETKILSKRLEKLEKITKRL